MIQSKGQIKLTYLINQVPKLHMVIIKILETQSTYLPPPNQLKHFDILQLLIILKLEYLVVIILEFTIRLNCLEILQKGLPLKQVEFMIKSFITIKLRQVNMIPSNFQIINMHIFRLYTGSKAKGNNQGLYFM
ncbi:hypothetical protein pb186bvf_019647 [Paramecium bursaria]